jgi:hypothetical protein
MLKMSASFVLASLRDSTYRSVRLASSLAAASPDGYFEHPAMWNLYNPIQWLMASLFTDRGNEEAHLVRGSEV